MERKKKIKAKIIYEGKTRKNIPTTTIIIALAVIAILAVGFLSQWTFFIQNEEMTDSVLVSINGAEITQMQLQEQWEALPIIAQMQITKDQLLEELVQETLLLQEAKKQHIIVSEEEVDQFINLQLSQMGMNYDQFEEALAAQGTSSEDMKEIYQKQLTVAKLFDNSIDNALNATDVEVLEYYETNKESFYREEQVKVRHILVEISETQNETKAQERVNLILSKLEAENKSNFCELVEEYSSDFGSVSNCGEYTFGKGQMAQEFEDAGYDMINEELRVVKTSYGFHIMLKIENIAEGYIALNESISGIEGSPDLAEGIEQVIIEEKAQGVFETYVTKLSENSEIIYFNPIDEYIDSEEFETIEIDLESAKSPENESDYAEEVNSSEEIEEEAKLVNLVETNESESIEG